MYIIYILKNLNKQNLNKFNIVPRKTVDNDW